MNIVLQEETTGCGFAATAMVAGKTYSEIKEHGCRVVHPCNRDATFLI